MKLNIPVYKWNFLLFLKSKSPYPPTPQVAYLIDAIWQPKLNGVRGGWSVELRLEKVATSAHMHIQWDWEQKTIGHKLWAENHTQPLLCWIHCEWHVESPLRPSLFPQFFSRPWLEKRKKTPTTCYCQPFLQFLFFSGQKEGYFFARKRILFVNENHKRSKQLTTFF